MEEQLISFKTAKLAKEKGFPQKNLFSCYREDGRLTNYSASAHGYYLAQKNQNNNPLIDFKCIAPTQSLLQKWLREKHNLHCLSDVTSTNTWYWKIYCLKTKTMLKTDDIYCKIYNTHEEALEVDLQEALKLIKNKSKKA